jgi:acyl-CoA synthetase
MTAESAADRTQLRDRWYREGYYRVETLSQVLEAAARSHPETRFCFHGEKGLRESTTGEICAEARMLAGALNRAGVRCGDVMAIQLPSWYETAVLYVAAIHVGAVLLPIVHTYGPAELEFVLPQSGAKWLAVPDKWRSVDYLERCGRTPAVKNLKGVIVLGECSASWALPWAELRKLDTENYPRPAQHADDLCVLLYTSGTTAAPKGVRHSHNTIRAEWEIPFLANRGPYLNPFPAGHIAGFNFMLRPMVCGIPMVFLDRWDADVAAELVERYGVTQTGGTPYFLLSLLEAATRSSRDLSSIKSYSLGATGVTPEHVRLAESVGWGAGRSYGLTEHSTVTRTDPSMPFEKRAYTDGRIQPGSEIRILDESGCNLPVGKEGEILTRGPELFLGYTDPALDLESFLPDGWFRTGDIGCLDKDGYLTVTDRKKDIIIRGGENISSREVEEALGRHPAVADVAAVSMPDERYGERVCAFVVLLPDHQLDFDGMSRHCAQTGLARYKTPERLLLVPALPRNPAGKVRKDELRRRLREG